MPLPALSRAYRRHLAWRLLLGVWFWTQFLPLWPDAWPRAATPSRVQGANSSHTSTTSGGTVWSGNTTSGNLIVVLVSRSGADAGVSVSSIVDSQTNTYVAAIVGDQQNSRRPEIWYAQNITGGTTPTVTVNMSATTTWRQWIIEVANASTTAALDQTSKFSTGTATTSFQCSSAGITTAADVIVVCVIATASVTNPFTAGSGYTGESGEGARSFAQYRISATSLSSDQGLHTGTSNTNYSACMASFKADAAAGGDLLLRMMGEGLFVGR